MNFSQTEKTENAHFCYESVNRSCPKHNYPAEIRTPLYVFFAIIIFLTVSGNLLVVISICHFKQLQTPTNYLILSLAVSDLLLGGVIMPPSMVSLLETCWYFGELFCKIHSSTDLMLSTASVLNLCFISIDRYYAVCQPLHYQTKITSCFTMIMIMVSWSVSAVFGFGMLFLELNILGNEDFYYDNVACVGGCIMFLTELASLLGSILCFYIPGFIMFVIYQKIFYVAQKQARSIHNIARNNVGSVNSKSSSHAERKATKTLAIVMGVFLSCWTPFFVCNIIIPFFNYSVSPVLIQTLVWVSYFNSTFNPIVYALFYSWYRRAIKMIIFGKIFQTRSSRIKLNTD